jgi:alpha-L-arabinofuranosidase
MKKIKDKVYKKEDIEKIVDEYNVWYEKYHFR